MGYDDVDRAKATGAVKGPERSGQLVEPAANGGWDREARVRAPCAVHPGLVLSRMGRSGPGCRLRLIPTLIRGESVKLPRAASPRSGLELDIAECEAKTAQREH